MDDWLTISEAAKVAGVAKTTIRTYVRNNKWDIEKRPRVPPSHGPPIWMVRRSTLEKYRDMRAKRRLTRNLQRKDKGEEVRAIVEWANGLKKWPSNAEIRKRETQTWRFKDIELLIDARVHRWDPDDTDKKLSALRPSTMDANEGSRYIYPAGGFEDTTRIVIPRSDDDES